MADRHSLHQPADNEGGLETNRPAFNPPFLPYERDLIVLLGCSEDEYRKLVRFNQLKPRIRPAAYDHIPDVVNDPITAIVVNLVIGLALTAVSVLLRPDPPTVDQDRKRIRNEKLPDQVGPSRFNQTSSFTGYSALVEYGTPVPIPFGKQGFGADGIASGGLTLAGSLVWSRAFSDGVNQRVKLLYSLGEYLPITASVEGIWIGTAALSSFGGYEYAAYWSSIVTANRIGGANLIGGTRATPEAGDPQPFNEVFTAPIDGAENGTGFCMVYNPQTKAAFGQYNPVRNGTAHRPNWEVVSIPYLLNDSDDAADSIRGERARRVKYSGTRASRTGFSGNGAGGQPGVGRAYGAKMGIASINGLQFPDKVSRFNVKTGDLLAFVIAAGDYTQLDNTGYGPSLSGTPNQYGISHKDISSAITSRRINVDQSMVPGSRWLIGATNWVVTGRTPGIWDVTKQINVEMKCVSIKGVPEIGIPGIRASTELLGGYEGPWFEEIDGPRPANITSEGFNRTKHCGAAFWNVCQYEVATARMVREADTIEFGIASTVWNKANGICNFNAIYPPSQQLGKDYDDVSLSTPTLNKYFARTSCFEVYVRPLPDYVPLGTVKPEWARLPQVFCVTGTTPTAMYNYLRIRPRIKGRYEFRFSPRTGSDIIQNGLDSAIFWRLNAQSGETFGQDMSTSYGDFRVTITGDKVARVAILGNPELIADPNTTVNLPVTTPVPTAVTVSQVLGNPSTDDFVQNAYLTQLFGRNPSNAGDRASARFVHFKPRGAGTDDDGYIEIQVSCTAGQGFGQKHIEMYGTGVSWAAGSVSYSVIQGPNTYGIWNVGDGFTNNRAITSSNRYKNIGYTSVSYVYRITNVQTVVTDPGGIFNDDRRTFEEFSQASDCSHYDEITKSCDTGPEHKIVYINEAVAESTEQGPPAYESLSMLGLSIKSGPSLSAIEQIRVWTPVGISVERLEAGAVGPSNLFSDFLYYLLTNKTQGTGEFISEELIDRQSFADTGKYLLQNKIFWNGVLESEQNLRSFAAENAGASLCMFTIKNGVYGLQPALPVDSSGAISTGAVPISQIFSAGNILDGSLKIAYQDIESRRTNGITVRWRVTRDFELPDEETAIVHFADEDPKLLEDLDLTSFCDNREQSLRTARYILATKRYVDHVVNFDTTPEALAVEPGSYIRVMMEELDYQQGLSIRIAEDMRIISAVPVEDGTYRANVYKPGAPDIEEIEIELAGGYAIDPELRGALASLFSVEPHSDIYQIREVSLSEEGIVSVTAAIVPTSGSQSRVAYDVLNNDNFTVIE